VELNHSYFFVYYEIGIRFWSGTNFFIGIPFVGFDSGRVDTVWG